MWEIDAVLVPTTPTPSPPLASLKMLGAYLSTATSTFATLVRAAPQVASQLLTTTFRGTVMVPTDQVGGGACARHTAGGAWCAAGTAGCNALGPAPVSAHLLLP